ncbi:hypothetical protein ACEZCY_29780 [Streptacidiphilus sp. N1-12]|uniref:Uncharacterized protein n=3 Tax=Streptacidiphilus alkalitolerans TaxID=3342712 RepID=A0ABV6VIE1_9ACTN
MAVDMAEDRLGEIIASRAIEAVYPDGRRTTLGIQIGRPRPNPDKSGDWECPCRIQGLGDSPVWTMYGVDSVQALTQAAEVLRRALTSAAADHALTFRWDGEDAAQALPVDDVLW